MEDRSYYNNKLLLFSCFSLLVHLNRHSLFDFSHSNTERNDDVIDTNEY